MGKSRYKIIHTDQPHFLTFTVLNWLPIFTRPETVNALCDCVEMQQKRGLKLYAYVILENHIHMIAQSESLPQHISSIKSYSARHILHILRTKNATTVLDQFKFYKKAHKRDRLYQFWQEGCHPKLIQGEQMMQQKIEYIHHNPVKRGYIEKAEHWNYSSARQYLGQEGLLEIVRFGG